jgi:hypothetical protein
MQRSQLQAVLTPILALILALALAVASAVVTAEVYRWVDADGNVHYGDRPPAAGVDSSTLSLPPAPVQEADQARRSLKQRRLLEAFEAERNQRNQAEAEAAAARRERARVCENARGELARFERANIVYTSDASGARVYMSDEERLDAVANVRAWIGKHCD